MIKKSKQLLVVPITLVCLSLGLNDSMAAISDGLVAHYDFEAANIGADASGNGHALTNFGATVGEGVKGSGANFNGVSWLETSNAADFDTATNFSWSVWINIQDEELPGGILSKSPDDFLPGSKVLFNEGGLILFGIEEVDFFEFDGGLADGEWHHVVAVATFPEDEEIGLVEFWVDGAWVGELEGEAAGFAEPAGSIFRVGLGSPGFDLEPVPEIPEFFGGLDEVRVYNRSLGDDEVVELLIDGLGGLPAPEIVGQPQDGQGIAGRSITLKVDADGLLLSYQWFKGADEIPDADGPSLTLEDLSAEDAGEYSVRVSNDTGDVQSESATLTILDAWTPAVNLAAHWNFDTAGTPGNDVSGNGNDLSDDGTSQGAGIKGQALELDRLGRLDDFNETFAPSTLSSFTWAAFIKTAEDGSIMGKSPDGWSPGSKTLFVRDGVLGFDTGWLGDVNGSTELTDDAWHHVAISVSIQDGDDYVELYVDGNPEASWEPDLEEQPDPGIFYIGYSSDDFPFEDEPGLNWFGGAIDEVRVYTQPLIQEDIITIMLEDGGAIAPAEIIGQPEDATVFEGRTARFTVEATGTGVTYQWKKGDVEIEDATGATLSISGVSDADEGQYSVVVSSTFTDPPTSVESESASLFVDPLPDFGGGELAHVAPFLESYWDFDAVDGDGLVPDLSPIGNHHGELLNGAVLTTGNQGIGGSGEALDSSAEEGARLEVSMPEGYDFNSAFTWSAWVKIFEEAGAGDPFGYGIMSRVSREEGHEPGAKVFFISGVTPGFDVGWVGAHNTEEPEMALDQWHHVAITYDPDGDLISMYLDGEPLIDPEFGELIDVDAFGEDTVIEFDDINTGFRIGSGANNVEEPFFSDPFIGLIDDAAVWSTALSADDIFLLVNGASPLPEEGEERPTIEIAVENDILTVEFTGTLECADDPEGPWKPVPGADTSFDVDTSAASQLYFRSIMTPQ